jgi:hypothetical protein
MPLKTPPPANRRRHSPHLIRRPTATRERLFEACEGRELSILAVRGFLQEHLTLAHAFAMFLCYLRMQLVAPNMRARCAELGVWMAAHKAPPTRIRDDLISQ